MPKSFRPDRSGIQGCRALALILGSGLFSGLFSALACSNPEAQLADDERSERAAHARYAVVLEPLAGALMRGDSPAIHAMLSAGLQNQKPLDAFIAEMQAARAEFGDPLQYETGISISDPEELAEYEEYAHIPPEDLLAYGYVTLALEIDAEGEFERCYDAWVLIVNDAGTPKIGEITFDWCD